MYNTLPPAVCDNCPSVTGSFNPGEWNPWQEDYDGDGKGDICDPCPFVSDPNCNGMGGPPQPPSNPWSATETRLSELLIYGSGAQGRIGTMRPDTLRSTSLVLATVFTRLVDRKEYELKDHLGNVRVVISDLKLLTSGTTTSPAFGMKKLVVNHYYAFGMMEEGMSQQGGEYRYGFNGKEAEKEWKGAGNALDYGARIYDPRLGRWMSVDRMSMKYPFASPYGFALNSPVLMSDVGGDSVWIETSTRLNSSGVLETVKTIHIVGKVLNISDDPMDVKKFAADVQSELEAKIIGIDPSDGSIIETSADIQVATSMSQVSSTDHLISIVDEVAGGGAAGTVNGYGGQSAFIENSGDMSQMIQTTIHEIGHQLGIGKTELYAFLKGAVDVENEYVNIGKLSTSELEANYMNSSMHKHRDRFHIDQVRKILSNIESGKVNLGENYELIEKDHNLDWLSNLWYSLFGQTSSESTPYNGPIHKSDKIPARAGAGQDYTNQHLTP